MTDAPAAPTARTDRPGYRFYVLAVLILIYMLNFLDRQIIGILAAIAIPKFQGAKERTFQATMQSDLRTLVTAQEVYYSNHSTYATDIAAITGYSPSRDVTVAIGGATATTWKATATHSGTSITCAIAMGDPTVGPDGIPVCK